MIDPVAGDDRLVGLVLAAGAGTRFGRPKALVTGQDGVRWLARTVGALEAGGCGSTYVVLGAAADEIRRIVPCGVPVVVASDWEMGMGVSLRAGIAAMKAAQPEARATVVMLVDTPGVGPEVVRRLVSATVGTCSGQRDRAVLALGRATYHGEIGHPVLLGRDHWDGVFASAQGDRGARRYLDGHDVTLVECGDIGTGDDIDNAEAFNAWVGQQT